MSGYVFELGTSTVTYTITETASGQSWSCSFTVTVEDHEAPVIICPGDIVVSNDPEICGAVVEFDDPEVSDNCGLALGEENAISFDYTGEEQTWTVPAGVTSIFVDLRGASGGVNNEGGTPDVYNDIEGFGGRLVGTIPVTPGDVIFINAGGAGNTGIGGAGGFNGGANGGAGFDFYGGGGGGGASDIRIGGNALANRKMVAGGGGGEGLNYFAGGDNGGNGGDLVGMNGTSGGGELDTPGAGGTQVSGGAGGSAAIYGFFYLNGSDGGFGFGGAGGADGAGGGGGGGYYGGGGAVWAGGGGGSNYADPSATGVFHTQGFQSGNGLVIIQYSQTASLVQVEGLPSGSIFPVGTTTNVFVVTDGSGNTASCSFDVTVTDDEDPAISCPQDVEITTSNLGTLGDCAGQYAWDHPIPSDNCAIDDFDFTYSNPDGTIDGPFDGQQIASLNISQEANHHFAVGTTTVTYYAVDIHGNATSCDFTVTVTDDEDPAFVNCPVDISVGNDVDKCGSNVVFSTPVASDNCGATVTLVDPSLPSGSLFPVGESTVIFHAEDAAGNLVVCEFTITVTDMQTPTAVCQDITVDLGDDGTVTIVPSDVDGGSSDNCPDDLILTINESEFNCDQVGDNLVTLTIEDGNENTSICVSTVTVRDVTPPTFTCPDPITVDGCDDLIPDVVTGITDQADNCGVLSTVQDPVAGLDFGQISGNSVDITVTVTDVNGNVTTCMVVLTIEDDDAPDFLNCPTVMIMIGNDPDQCSGKVNWQPPVAVDDCLPLLLSAPGVPLPGTVVQIGGPLPGLSQSAITCPPTPTTISYRATDGTGNVAICTFDIMVVDTEKPEFDADIVMPTDITVDCHAIPTNCVYHGPLVFAAL